MHIYCTHSCGALRAADIGQDRPPVGLIHRKRDHGNLLFVDLRDHFGPTQCAGYLEPAVQGGGADPVESVVTITGKVVCEPRRPRTPLPTGEIEVRSRNSSCSPRPTWNCRSRSTATRTPARKSA